MRCSCPADRISTVVAAMVRARVVGGGESESVVSSAGQTKKKKGDRRDGRDKMQRESINRIKQQGDNGEQHGDNDEQEGDNGQR